VRHEGNDAEDGMTMAATDLVKELRRQVTALESDLRARSEEVPEAAKRLQAEYADAKEAKRTAATYEAWREERVTQVAAAWVLGTVFVRYCEDNDLIARPFIAGPGERLAEAEERHEAHFRNHPHDNDRDWIIAAFDHLADAHPTAAGLFDKAHNPLWEIPPSFEAATALLQYWRRRDDNGEIRIAFTGWDTRFLGDLYQDLSEHARKTYALLQTPEFVEEFILDLTLEPAVEEFGLRGLRTIDPACGSGHFLLGIFHRLLAKWRAAEPGTDLWDLIRRSLESVHGCDKNPFAASIARFRLLVAVLRSAGVSRLDKAQVFPINIAVGDSLMHGRGVNWEQLELDLSDGRKVHSYRTEDVAEFASRDLLGLHSYHVVVGNPPYITVKDKQENDNYRQVYKKVCSGKYALSVPFAQRLFDLAIRTSGGDRDAGFVGQITANSFMKREFGKKLIEDFFPNVHLTHVIDTSGAYIPGHGTPTVILVSRNHIARKGDPIRAVLGVRGEPSQPKIASEGLVWSAIVHQFGSPGSESEWISVDDADRVIYLKYPWSLSGGGASDVLRSISVTETTVKARISRPIGFASFSGVDEVFYLPPGWHTRFKTPQFLQRPIVTGEDVRDWQLSPVQIAIVPYAHDGRLIDVDLESSWGRHLWPYRQIMGSLTDFTRTSRFDSAIPWWSWYRWVADRYARQVWIAFSHVATQMHAAYGAGRLTFNQHSPVIELPEGASEDAHLALLGVLNSSTACFWLKQVSQAKAGGGTGRGMQDEAWEERYEFTGTKLQEFPLPAVLPSEFGRALDSLAQRLATQEPAAVCVGAVPSRDRLDGARAEHERLRCRMIALQEELDWTTYHSYGLLTDTEHAQLTASDRDSVPEIKLGERAFEIVLARKIAAGEVETAWFARHGATPITESPTQWPERYQRIVRARIDIIEKRRDIALIERPECKRRWAAQPWEKKEAEALRTWLLGRCERRDIWFGLRDGFEQPRTLTVNQLADRFRDDADVQSVAQLYATSHLGKRDLTLAQVFDTIVADQHVPYLAAVRYKDSGLRKRKQWEDVWEQQRSEDRTGQRFDIPVPPKYTSADFSKNSYWSQRGKLDVPKERFISYPGANLDGDPTLLLGWAGWDHRDQAQALINLVNDRTSAAGWETDRLTPLLAGLAEVLPWVHQWHGEYDEEWGGNPAEDCQTFLTEQRNRHLLTDDDLTAWRPVPTTRGRRAIKAKNG
jgi:hypothetical protein